MRSAEYTSCIRSKGKRAFRTPVNPGTDNYVSASPLSSLPVHPDSDSDSDSDSYPDLKKFNIIVSGAAAAEDDDEDEDDDDDNSSTLLRKAMIKDPNL